MKTLDEKLTEGRQYRGFDTHKLETRAEDESKVVEGYATVFNTPYTLYTDGDYTVLEQIDRRAFDECDMSDVIMQYDHAGRVFARTSNATLVVTPDEYGLRIRAELGGTDIGRALYEEIQGGYTTKMSFGFVVGADERLSKEENGKTVITRTITKITKLYDVSAVSLPANDATSISARSFGEGVIAEAEQERFEREQRAAKIKKLKILCTM